MPTYTNPSGLVNATNGDDIIIFNAPWQSGTNINALGGSDSLFLEIDSTSPITIDALDEFDDGHFNLDIRFDPFSPLYVFNVENIELHGTANDDTFVLRIGPNSSALTATMDGGAGRDLLSFNWSKLTTGMSFVDNGTAITSGFGTFTNFEIFNIYAGSGNDTITTGSGDDTVYTGAGLDIVSTGAGNDFVEFESSGGTVAAGDGDDFISLITVPTQSFSVDGGAGQDILRLYWWDVSTAIDFNSSSGTFTNLEQFLIWSGSGADTITTGSANDEIFTGSGNDTVSAGAGNDEINGDSGNDTINGDAGDDKLSGQAGDDFVSGGDGNDLMYGDASLPFSSAGDGIDQLNGGLGNDTLYGGGNNDTINGGGHNDRLYGGAGADNLNGGEGNDWLTGYGESVYGTPDDNVSDVLEGGAGDDFINMSYGDAVDGGSGTDSLYVALFSASTGVSADFRQLTSGGTMTIGGATLAGIEYVTGISLTHFDDTVAAGAVAGIEGVTLDGWGGNDNLTGSSGVDSIWGGDGNDVIYGGVGFNPNIAPSTDRLRGEAGDDIIHIGSDGAEAFGGVGNDTIYGGDAYDEIFGDGGNDLLNAGGGNDGITGGDGDDYIDGGTGADFMAGNDGNDTLTGGSGSDTFRDTAADMAGDTISDFSADDKIVISDASLGSFSYSLAGNVLSYSGGTLTLIGFTGGLDVSAAPGGGVQLTVADARHDFNRDGRSDILWRNDNGTVTDWLGRIDGRFEGNIDDVNIKVGLDWQVAGVGDFNGDGRDDVIWRRDTGALAEWLGQIDGGFAGNAAANLSVATSWHVEGVGDFNGDGFDDLLWRNDNGTVTDWLGRIDGRFDGNSDDANIQVAGSWHVAGTGDFNGDGRDDVIWRNDNGAVAEWLGQGDGGFVGNASANANVATNWHIEGVGDFNGDGRDDILWRNDNGTVTDWLGRIDGRFDGNTDDVNITVGAIWDVASIGDFNGDGRDDVLWRNDNGAIIEWLGQANGGFTGNAGANYQVDPSWHVQSPDLWA